MCLDFISTVCCATLAGHDGHPHLGHDTDHIVPDFDDPDIPARVWDAYLRDGKITQEERERVAQHAAETGRAGKRTRDDIDTTGETQKKAKIERWARLWGLGAPQGAPHHATYWAFFLCPRWDVVQPRT